MDRFFGGVNGCGNEVGWRSGDRFFVVNYFGMYIICVNVIIYLLGNIYLKFNLKFVFFGNCFNVFVIEIENICVYLFFYIFILFLMVFRFVKENSLNFCLWKKVWNV